MQINGVWLICDDGVVRPLVRGEVLAGNGAWEGVEFLLTLAPTELCSAQQHLQN